MMQGGDIAGLLIRQARLGRDWSQAGLCRGICAPSYLSKIEQGKAAPSPEVMELLFRRLDLVWTPEPESLEPCWKALLYFSALPHPSLLDLHKLAICHEQLGHREQALTAVQQAEPLASGEIERQMLALVRYRLEHPGYLHDSTYGTQLLDCFQRLRDTYPMGFTRFHLPWVLAWYKANRQYRQAFRLLEEFPVK